MLSIISSEKCKTQIHISLHIGITLLDCILSQNGVIADEISPFPSLCRHRLILKSGKLKRKEKIRSYWNNDLDVYKWNVYHYSN